MADEQGRGHRKIVPRKHLSALEKLAEMRKSGVKREDRFDVAEEAPVYDEMNDAEYAKMAQKWREEGGEPGWSAAGCRRLCRRNICNPR